MSTPVEVVAEFTIEPFVEGSPGPHVTAGLDAVRTAGFDPASIDVVAMSHLHFDHAGGNEWVGLDLDRLGGWAATLDFGTTPDHHESCVAGLTDARTRGMSSPV